MTQLSLSSSAANATTAAAASLAGPTEPVTSIIPATGGTDTVTTFAQLNADIDAADAATSGAFVIDLGADISETGQLDAISLHSGVTLVINGASATSGQPNHTLNGGGVYRGLFVYSGQVTVENLTIANAVAKGGAGASGGGGGAGLGGGLFVAGSGDLGQMVVPVVTLSGVSFSGDAAQGGAGASGAGGGGGGGGLGGSGGTYYGGGGGIGSAAQGGNGGATGQGGAGSVPATASGGDGYDQVGTGGGNGGGGGANSSGSHGGGGGGIGGTIATEYKGGAGGFGGGGGGNTIAGGSGGFGGGGGGAIGTAGDGGFGGGGGGGGGNNGVSDTGHAGHAGFGGGPGVAYDPSTGDSGGGGLAAGGDIFVQSGGTVLIEGGSLAAGSIKGGKGAFGNDGAALGSSVFLQGNDSLLLGAPVGQTVTVGGIADQTGSGGAGANAGTGTVEVGSLTNGLTGTVVFNGMNTYSGATVVNAGALVLSLTGSIVNSSSLSVQMGATVDLSQSGELTLHGLTGSGTVFIGGQTLTIDDNTDYIFAGSIRSEGLSGYISGGLTKSGSAILTLAGLNTYLGTTEVLGGTLAIASSGSILSSRNVVLATSTILDVSAGDQTIPNLSGSGVVRLGGSFLTLNETEGSSFDGSFQDNGNFGSIVVQGADSLSLSGISTLTGEVRIQKGSSLFLTANGIGGDFPDAGSIVDEGTLLLEQSGSATYITPISGIGDLTIAGGSTALSQDEAYTGNTYVLGGTLVLTSGSSISTSKSVVLNAGTVFDVSGASADGTVTIQELSGVAGSTIRLGGGVLSVTETTAATYAGSITDGGVAGGVGGALVVNGSAPLTLTGTDSYTGKTQIYGQLDLAGSAVLNQSKAVTLKASGAVFDISQATGKEAILNLAGVAGSHIDLGGNSLKINDSTSATFSGVISDGGAAGGTGGALIVKGAASLDLTGANTFTGGVTLLSGTLELGTTTAAGVGHALTFTGAATLQLDAGSLTGSGASHSYGTGIAGFASGDHIDLSSLAYAAGASASYDGSTLTVTSGGSTVTLTLSGLPADDTFSAATDGQGHVLVGAGRRRLMLGWMDRFEQRMSGNRTDLNDRYWRRADGTNPACESCARVVPSSLLAGDCE